MKNAVLFMVTWFLHFTLNAQITLAGKITNPKNKEVKLSYWNGVENTLMAKVNKDGSFRIQGDCDKPTSFEFEHGEEVTKLFLYPNDSICMTLNTKQFDESITYRGKGAEVNNYLIKQYLNFENSIESPNFPQTYYRKIAFSDALTFTKYADSLAEVQLTYLNQNKSTLPKAFYDYQYAQIVYRYANDKIDYPVLHYYVQGIKDSVVQVGPEYYGFYNTLNLDNEHFLASTNFVLYLNHFITYKARLNFKRDSISSGDKVVCARFLLKGPFLQKALGDIILQTLDYGTQAEVKDMYAISKNEITDSKLNKIIDQKYQLILSLMPGSFAPSFSLKDKNGVMVSLSSLKGKVVYLDFWASWCGPCLMEIPSAKILQDSFKTKDVVFLYISIDEEEKSWLSTMAAKKMQGIHLLAKGFNHEVPAKYGVNGIPKYYLIGKDGKIINNLAARPSDKRVYKQLEDALAIP